MPRVVSGEIKNNSRFRTGQLLSHCVIDFPRRSSARVPLFQAATKAQSDNYGLAIIEPLFQTQYFHPDVQQAGSEEEQIVSSSEDEEESGDESNTLSSGEEQLSPAQRARVTKLIADTMVRVAACRTRCRSTRQRAALKGLWRIDNC